MQFSLENFFEGCKKNPPVSVTLLEKMNNILPKTLLDFFRFSNGIEGTVGNGTYLQMWKLEELEERNKSYNTLNFIPGLYLVGSDGGGEAVAIDMRAESNTYGYFYRVPFIPLNWNNAVVLGPNITDIIIQG